MNQEIPEMLRTGRSFANLAGNAWENFLTALPLCVLRSRRVALPGHWLFAEVRLPILRAKGRRAGPGPVPVQDRRTPQSRSRRWRMPGNIARCARVPRETARERRPRETRRDVNNR